MGPGGTYFFTIATHCRRRFLTNELPRRCLHEAIDKVKRRWPFEVIAIVLLPDHFHTIWALPRGDADFSLRLRRIKELFTREYLNCGGTELTQSVSRQSHGQRGIWQKRFWEHTVQNDDDLKRCVDYVHWNPKKHGFVTSVKEWQWSSFHRFVQMGEYDLAWGGHDPTPGFDMPEWST